MKTQRTPATVGAMTMLRRTIHPEIRVLDEKLGICEYIASDETLDSYQEVIKADGWRFDDFRKNAPFVDSHDYSTIGNCLGKVLDFKVEKRQLLETVQWAINLGGGETLADWGWKMTVGGFLKAVSVGFMPVRYATKWDSDMTNFMAALKDIDMTEDVNNVRCIYLEQQQKELSACVIGANPSAVAKAYKDGLLTDKALELFSAEHAKRETACSTDTPADVLQARQRAQDRFLLEFTLQLNQL